jgi:hypothetical protein
MTNIGNATGPVAGLESAAAEAQVEAQLEAQRPPLTPEAKRALAEAAERRAARDASLVAQPGEYGGQKGPDPVRYGDWEKAGIVSDF